MTLKRKLIAIGYKNSDINLNDTRELKKIVNWLEEFKIMHYNLEERKHLMNINSNEWTTHFTQYLKDLQCPVELEFVEARLDWLIGYAVQIEYRKNAQQFNQYAIDNLKTENTPNVVADNILDHLDFTSIEFKNGIDKIAKLLNIVPHSDALITLEACSTLIQHRLHSKALENPNEFILKGVSFPFEDIDLGFDLNDNTLNLAAKLLRLLYIQDLRNLQTKTNECIVTIQNLTANPKTDTALGKVGK